ncbi:MAG: hypothetical protein ABJB16_02610 [Saprospiraceae bacterium]
MILQYICKRLTLVSNTDAETTTTWQDGSDLSTYIGYAPEIYTIHEQNA